MKRGGEEGVKRDRESFFLSRINSPGTAIAKIGDAENAGQENVAHSRTGVL